MTYGTSYFVSRKAAIRYYRAYEGSGAPAAVARKIREGQIHIGKPPLKAGDRLSLIDGRTRYAISNPKRRKRTAARRKKNPVRVAASLAGKSTGWLPAKAVRVVRGKHGARVDIKR